MATTPFKYQAPFPLGPDTKIEHNLIMCQFANLPIGKLVII